MRKRTVLVFGSLVLLTCPRGLRPVPGRPCTRRRCTRLAAAGIDRTPEEVGLSSERLAANCPRHSEER